LLALLGGGLQLPLSYNGLKSRYVPACLFEHGRVFQLFGYRLCAEVEQMSLQSSQFVLQFLVRQFSYLVYFHYATLNRLTPGYESASHGHFVRYSPQSGAGGILVHAADFKQDRSRLDDGDPFVNLALAFSHANFQRFAGDGLVRKYTNMDASLTVQEVSGGDSAGLYLLGRYPTGFHALEAVIAEGHPVATGGHSAIFASLLLTELDSFGH
jgi:hypothetical protein